MTTRITFCSRILSPKTFFLFLFFSYNGCVFHLFRWVSKYMMICVLTTLIPYYKKTYDPTPGRKYSQKQNGGFIQAKPAGICIQKSFGSSKVVSGKV